MQLSEYILLERGNASRLAAGLGQSQSYLSQLSSGHRKASPSRAVKIESLTGGKVTRQDMRPEDWRDIWPELVK